MLRKLVRGGNKGAVWSAASVAAALAMGALLVAFTREQCDDTHRTARQQDGKTPLFPTTAVLIVPVLATFSIFTSEMGGVVDGFPARPVGKFATGFYILVYSP